jgi:hypothetical protein
MTPTSIADFSLQATRRYIQSAVFIDDNIYSQTTASLEDLENIEVRHPKPVIQSDAAGQALLTEKHGTGDQAVREIKPPFRTKDLVGAFAEHGIVCALYEPEPDFPTDETSTVFKLCQTADLVILDWDFHEVGVSGTKPKALIEKLITSGNRVAPHHVRLIAIFTNTPSLQSIANSIYQHLATNAIPTDTIGNSYLRLQAGAARVIVLGKAGGTTRVEAEQPFTVAESDLANRLLQEFAAMNQGILPSCALLGMAAVRRNSRRILDKFRPDLDAQFLLHRALIRSSEEAFDQLPELLGDEFKAAIEDTDFRPDDPIRFVTESCAEVPIKPHSQPWKVEGETCENMLRKFWSVDNSLQKPIIGKKAHDNDGPQPKKAVEALASMCSGTDNQAHHRFAALLTVRTQYQIKHRDLAFGVVVLNRSTREYSVCLMPLCDSLRLTSATAFPFWKLVPSGRGNPVIIQCDDGGLLKLIFEVGRPSRYLWMGTFSPDLIRGVVSASKDSLQKPIFISNGLEFEWISQLKPSHAQRIANAVGQQLSRVGLTEAEWARVTFTND